MPPQFQNQFDAPNVTPKKSKKWIWILVPLTIMVLLFVYGFLSIRFMWWPDCPRLAQRTSLFKSCEPIYSDWPESFKQHFKQLDRTSTPVIDTSNWKIYTNTEHGFEFKYPGDWTLKDDVKPSDCSDSVDCIEQNKNYDIKVQYSSGIPSPTYCLVNPSDTPRCEAETRIDWGAKSGDEANVQLGKYTTNISLYMRNVTESRKPIFRQILSTFKFFEIYTTDSGIKCLKIPTKVRNKSTGEIKEYPAPCAIPGWWEESEWEVIK